MVNAELGVYTGLMIAADHVTIRDITQVTPEWLTTVLAQCGALTAGVVTRVEVERGESNWSAHARLRVSYTHDARGELPEALFLKMVDCSLSGFGASEVRYYTRDYTDVAGAPLVRCFDAAYDEDGAWYHVLLEDLFSTHEVAFNKTPTLDYALALAEGFAAMHARWWGAGKLAEYGEKMPQVDKVERFVDVARSGLGPLFDASAGELGSANVELIEEVFDRHPRALVNRIGEPSGFAVIHGDPNSTNILVPRCGDRPIYILDRQPFDWSLTVWLAIYDLSYAIVHRWEPDMRWRLEEAMLHRYHDRLCELGVVEYSWEQLMDDYRLCASMNIYVVVESFAGGASEAVRARWLPRLFNTLTAIADLDAREVWDSSS